MISHKLYIILKFLLSVPPPPSRLQLCYSVPLEDGSPVDISWVVSDVCRHTGNP